MRALRLLWSEYLAANWSARELYWRERTEPGAATAKLAQQRAAAARRAHEILTGSRMEDAIDAAQQETPDSAEVATAARRHRRERRLDAAEIELHTAVAARTRAAWSQARQADSFEEFAPALGEMLDTMRRQAESLGYEREPYDALLDTWEPGMTAAALDGMFAELEPIRELRSFLPEPSRDLMRHSFDPAAKPEFERALLADLGFDFSRGRIDYSERAFCIVLGLDDVRLTSRFLGDSRLTTVFSSIHEAGHGIYAQSAGRLGLPVTVADAPSLGLDESQSRLFENGVARDPRFWDAHADRVARAFPDAAHHISDDSLWRTFSGSRPGALRVGCDELHYDAHIELRFRIERALVNGDISARQLPEVWNAAAADLLGAAPTSEALGCLQDVHWSIGQWGYFPTYTLGNVYAAELLAAAVAQVPAIDGELAAGRTDALIEWLDRNVYRYGSALSSAEIVERAIGRPPSAAALLAYLRDRYAR